VVGEFRPLVRPGIAGVGEKICLLAVQERCGLIDVGVVGGGTGERVHHAQGHVSADMRLHPEMLLIAHLGLVHRRITALLLVLVDGGAAMLVALTIVPCRISKPRAFSIAPTSSNSTRVRSCFSSQ
jgi:hypothetical protein